MPVYSRLPQAGGERATALWTNASPTSNFAAQTITLSAAMTDFERIEIVYKYTTTGTEYHAYFDVTDYTYTGSYADEFGIISRPGLAGYMRRLIMASATTISFTTAYRLNNSGSSNAYAIPVAVYGIQ